MHVLPGEPLAQIREWLGASSAPEQTMRDEAHRQLRELVTDLAGARHVQVNTEDATGSPLDEILWGADRLDAATVEMYRQQAHAQGRQRVFAPSDEAGLSPSTWSCWASTASRPRRTCCSAA